MEHQPPDGFVLWFTGLPASGKTTLAKTVQTQLAQRGIQTLILDSDDLRSVLTPEPAYTEQERRWFYNVITYLATFLSKNGLNVLIAATANRRSYRDQARKQISRFAEIYVQCTLQACKERDPKGIYALAERGEADSVPGMGVGYEPPFEPEAAVDTTGSTPSEAAQIVLAQLQAQDIVLI